MDLPIENGGSFHSFLYVYQRVMEVELPLILRTSELITPLRFAELIPAKSPEVVQDEAQRRNLFESSISFMKIILYINIYSQVLGPAR